MQRVRLSCLLMPVLLAGCFPGPVAVDQELRELTHRASEHAGERAVDALPAIARKAEMRATETLVEPAVQQTSYQPALDDKGPSSFNRLRVPPALPGANAPPIRPLPPLGDPKRHQAIREM